MTGYPRTVRYFLPLGALAAAAVLAFALVPLSQAGFVSFGVVVLGVLIDRSTRSLGTRARGAAEVTHLVVAGSAFVFALILAATLGRGELYWVSVLGSSLVFLLFVIGGWVCERRQRLRASRVAGR